MRPLLLKTFFLSGIISCGIGISSFAQSIVGPDVVTAGQTYTYTVDFGDFSNTPTECGENSSSLNLWWLDDATGQTNYPPSSVNNITITFGDVNGSATLYVEFYCFEADLYYTRSKTITITGAVPQLPLTPSSYTITQNCFGAATVQRPDPLSGDVTYYWQTSADGTSMSNSNKTISLTGSQDLYLRAKNNVGWSTGSAGGYVTVVGHNLQQPADIYHCETEAHLPISLPSLLNVSGSQWKIHFGSSTFILSNAAASSFTPIDYANDYGEEFSQGRVIHFEYTVSQNGCTRNGFTSIYVKSNGARPVIQAQGPTTFCDGGSAILQVQSSGHSFQWMRNGQPLAGGTNLSYPATLSGNYTFKHVNNNGCPSESAPVTVTVTPLPTASIQPLGALSICQGSNVGLQAQSNGGSFQWMRNGQVQPEGNGLSVYPATQGGSYTLRASANGCSKVSAPVSVTVQPLPTAAIQPLGVTTICEGGSVQLQGQTNGNSFQWLLNGQPQTGSLLYTATSAGSYKLKTFFTNGCTNESAPIAITLLPLPTASVQPLGATTFCTGSNVQLQGQTNGNSFQWLKNGEVQPEATLTYTATQSGAYTLKSFFSTGCFRVSSPVIITSRPLPPATVTPQGSALITFGSTSVLLSANSGTGYSYQWFKNNQPIGGATGQTYPASEPGSYTVRVTDAQGCSSASDPTAVAPENDYNYIITRSLTADKKADGSSITGADVTSLSEDRMQQRITYYDGLGKPMQHVMVKGAPTRKDIVTPVTYDVYGREVTKYLPYVADEISGRYKKDALKDPQTTAETPEQQYRSGKQFLFYQPGGKVASDLYPYEQTVFEPGPLNRTLKQGAAGQTWQPDNVYGYQSTDRTVKRSYGTNAAREILLWTYIAPSQSHPLGLVEASSGGAAIYYDAGVLDRNKTKDEHQNEVIEYIDKDGRAVLKKVQIDETTYAETYYIYDDFGTLVCVLPPEAVKLITGSFANYFGKSADDKDDFLGRWAFRYAFTDARRRMTHKQMPGAEPVYMVYDKRDRLVMTQDGNQRDDRQWTFTKYDLFNRPVVTGIYTHGTVIDQEQMRGLISVNNLYETYNGNAAAYGYTANVFPTENIQVLSVTYYDNYDFKSLISGTGFDYNKNELQGLYQNSGGPATVAFNKVRGQVTGQRSKTLNNGGSLLWSVNYYDDQYRLVQTVTEYPKGVVRTSNTYDFAGKLLTTFSRAVVDETEKTVKKAFTYDHIGRLLQTRHAIDGVSELVLSENEYNALGQLVTKKLHKPEPQPVAADPAVGQPGVRYNKDIVSPEYTTAQPTYIASNSIKLIAGFRVTGGNVFKARIGYSQQDADAYNGALEKDFLQAVDYRYNIRGWLTRINNADLNTTADEGPKDYFGMEFGYNNDLGIGTFTPQYNGNISAAKWSANLGLAAAGEPTERAGKFTYDGMNRMLSSRHASKIGSWHNSPAFKEFVDYDLNGNILGLSRNDQEGMSLDRLVYHYGDGASKSDQLLSVSDGGLSGGFMDGNTTGDDYSYDANGNVEKDLNKGIEEIRYGDYLNLIEEVDKETGEKIKYIYNAEGIKLAEEIYEAGSQTPSRRTDYLNSFVFENDTLKFIQHDEGKVIIPKPQSADPSPEYQYQIKDHVGNVRLTFTAKEKTVEFRATMEDNGQANYNNPRVQEMANFGNLFESEVRNVNQWLNHTSNAIGNTAYLDGSEARTVGPYTILKVYPGDTVRMKVYGKYERSGSYNAMSLATLLATLLTPTNAALTAEAGIAPGGDLMDLMSPFMAAKNSDGLRPNADLNYILFDKDLNIISFNYDRIAESAGFNPVQENTVNFDELSLEKIVDRVGYLYIYVSNESPGSRVWMDDLTITHIQSRIVQFEDYYPFGLSMSETAFERGNDQYKGMVTTGGTGLKDLGFRQYDPALGRFHAVDPLAELQWDHSPYQYAWNNPVNRVDVLGLDADDDSDKKKQRVWRKDGYSRKKKDEKGTQREQHRRQRQAARAAARKEKKSGKENPNGSNTGQPGTQNDDGAKKVKTANSQKDKAHTVTSDEIQSAIEKFLSEQTAPDEKDAMEGMPNSLNNRPSGRNPRYEPTLPGHYGPDAMYAEDPVVPGTTSHPLIRDYETAQKAADPERLRAHMRQYHSPNEARALLYDAIVRNGNPQSMQLRQHYATLGNTTTSDDNVAPVEEPEPSPVASSTNIQMLLRQIRDSYKHNAVVRTTQITSRFNFLITDLKLVQRQINGVKIKIKTNNQSLNFASVIKNKNDHYFSITENNVAYLGIRLPNIDILVKQADDRDFIWDFITGAIPDFNFNSGQPVTLGGEQYSLQRIANDMDALRGQLMTNTDPEHHYDQLDKDGKLILDLPLIEWQLGWRYTSIFMFNWLTGGGNIQFNNFENTTLVSDPLFQLKFNQGQQRMQVKENLFTSANQQAELKKLITTAKTLGVDGERFISLNDGMSYFFNSNATMDEVKDNFGDMAGSFGRFSLLYSFTGTVKKTSATTAEVTISKVYYRIRNDSFDFGPTGFNFSYEGTTDMLQPLGSWKHDVYDPAPPSSDRTDYFIGLKNYNFRTFQETSGLGQDYTITTNYVEVTKPFTKIILNLDEEEASEQFEIQE